MTGNPKPSHFTEAEWKSFLARRNRPPEERFQSLVDDGIIDEKGNVLIRMPFLASDEVGDEPEDGGRNGKTTSQ